MQQIGLFISASVHGGVILLAVLGGQLFQPKDEGLQVVDAEILSEEAFAALTAPPTAGDAPAEPLVERLASFESPSQVEPPPEPEPIESEAPDPLLIEEEPAPPEVEDQVEQQPPDPPESDAPYAAAPEAPSDVALDPNALSDRSADAAIREALPPVSLSEEQDAPRAADPAPAPTPRQPQIASQDTAPQPDTPAPEPPREPESEPEVVEEDPAPRIALSPRQRPNRPPRPQQPKTAQAEEPKSDDFLSNITDALDGLPDQSSAPQSDGRQRGRLSTTDKEGLRFALNRCWTQPNVGRTNPEELIVTLDFDLDQSGRLLGEPVLVRPSGALTTRQDAAYRSARAALQRCQPFNTLPADKYESWRYLRIHFNPSEGISF